MHYVEEAEVVNYRILYKEIGMIKDLDTVVLSRNVPENGLKRGDIGAVVHCYKSGKGFEVEFITGKGETVAVVTLNKEGVRPSGRRLSAKANRGNPCRF